MDGKAGLKVNAMHDRSGVGLGLGGKRGFPLKVLGIQNRKIVPPNRWLCWVCYLPGKVRMADNIGQPVRRASSRTLSVTFCKYYLMSLCKIRF